MRPPQPEGAPPWEISMEELETLVEQARAVRAEDGYKKLLGAVRTLRYVTELLRRRKRAWRICASCCVQPRPRKRRRY